MDLGQNRFSERYKAAAARGVEALRVKQARSRALSQKENRDRQLRKSRRFDTIPLMALQEVEAEEPGPPKSSEAAVPSQMTRLEMLRRYKEEKLLRKLKAEREKPKQIFKVGIYKPDVTPFQSQNIMKAKAPGVVPSSSDLRVTRSMTKKQELLLKKAPSVSKCAAPIKVGPVKGNISNNRGSSTVVTGTRSQHHATSHQAAGPKVPIAREKKDVKAAPIKPLQTRSRLEPKIAPKAVKPVQVPKSQASINKTKKLGQPGEKSNCKLAVHDEPVSVPCEEQDMEVTEKDQPPSCKEPIQPTENDTGLQIPPVLGTGRVGKRISFAPENYVFAPMPGLAQLKFPPLSPRSVNNFFASCSWSPVEHRSKNNVVSSTTPNLVTRTRSKLVPNFESEHLPEAKCEDPVGAVIEEVSAPNKPQDSSASCTTDVSGPLHNVAYFRGIVQSGTESLTGLCQQWEGRANSAEVPDHVKDLIRTTVGQARLLMAERFKQFNGLVDDCEFKTSEKEVTYTDLEGFWDMVYFQVEDVNKKFEHLRKLQENNWEEPNELLSVPKKMVKKKVAILKPTEDPAIKANKSMIAPKSSLAALKASMKAKLKREVTGTNRQENQQDVIVFDAGFFRVESPAKGFAAFPDTCSVVDRVSQQQPKEQCTPVKGLRDSSTLTSSILSTCDEPNHQTSERKVSKGLPETDVPVMKKDTGSSVAEESTAQDTLLQKGHEEVNTSLDFAKYLQPRSSVSTLPEVLKSPIHDGCDATSICTKNSSCYNGISELSSSPLGYDDVEMKSPVSQQSSTGAQSIPQEVLQQSNILAVSPSSISVTQTPSFGSVNDLLVAGAVLHNVQPAENCMSPFETMVGTGDRHMLPLQVSLQDLISFSPSGTPQ